MSSIKQLARTTTAELFLAQKARPLVRSRVDSHQAMEKEAEEEMKKGNFRKAREVFETLLQRDKRKVQFVLGKADCLVSEGCLADSLPFYCEAIKIGKVRPDHLYRLISGLVQVINKGGNFSQSEETSTLQCGVCTGTLSEPITIPCGHTFCKLCLEKQESKSCAACGQSTSYVPLKINVVLQDIFEKCFRNKLEATRLRLEGNCLHRKKQNEDAIEKYREAVKMREYLTDLFQDVSVLCNFASNET